MNNKPLVVAHILKDLDIGGIQTLLLDLFTFVKENKLPYYLICIGEGELKEQFKNLGEQVIFLKKRLPYFDPFMAYKLRKLLLNKKVDIVHTHHTSEGLAAFFAVKGTSIKLVQSFHVAPSISNFQDNVVLKFLAKKANLGVCPTQSQLRTLKAYGYDTSKLKVVYNGVHPSRLDISDNLAIREKFGVSNSDFLIVCIGNFYNQTRDQLTICKALPEVFKKHPSAKMLFFGGVTNRYIKKSKSYIDCKAFCDSNGISNKVHFCGKETNIAAILSASQLFVYASEGDTFGMAVCEAMMFGLPIVANDLDVLEEISSGFIEFFKTKDPISAANKINEAIDNYETSTTYLKAKKYSLENYSIASHCSSLNLLYNEL